MKLLSFVALSFVLLAQVPAFSDVGACKVRLNYLTVPYSESRYTQCSAQYPCPAPDDVHFYNGPRELTYEYVVNRNSNYKQAINDMNNDPQNISKYNKLNRTVDIYGETINASDLKFQYKNEINMNRAMWSDGNRYQKFLRVSSFDTNSVDVAGLLWGDVKPTGNFGVFVGITHYDKKKDVITTDSSAYLYYICK